MTSAGREPGMPRGGSVRTARAFDSCDVINPGPASSAMPQVGEPLFPRVHAAATSNSRGSSRFVACMGANVTLMRPNRGHRNRTDWRERLRHQVIDVIE